jgi:hypothetical protein
MWEQRQGSPLLHDPEAYNVTTSELHKALCRRTRTGPRVTGEEWVRDVHKRVVNADALLVLKSPFFQGHEFIVTHELELARRGGQVLGRPGGRGEVRGHGFSPCGCSPLGNSGKDGLERDNRLAAWRGGWKRWRWRWRRWRGLYGAWLPEATVEGA